MSSEDNISPSVDPNFSGLDLTNVTDNITGESSTQPVPGSVQSPPREWLYLLLVPVIAASLLLNGLLLVGVLRHNKLKRTIFCLLASLATANILVSVLVMPLGLMKAVTGEFALSPAWCRAWQCLGTVLMASALVHLCFCVSDCQVRLLNPIKYHLRTVGTYTALNVGLAWAASLLLLIPLLALLLTAPTPLDPRCTRLAYEQVLTKTVLTFFLPALLVMLLTLSAYRYHTRRLNLAKKLQSDNNSNLSTSAGDVSGVERLEVTATSLAEPSRVLGQDEELQLGDNVDIDFADLKLELKDKLLENGLTNAENTMNGGPASDMAGRVVLLGNEPNNNGNCVTDTAQVHHEAELDTESGTPNNPDGESMSECEKEEVHDLLNGSSGITGDDRRTITGVTPGEYIHFPVSGTHDADSAQNIQSSVEHEELPTTNSQGSEEVEDIPISNNRDPEYTEDILFPNNHDSPDSEQVEHVANSRHLEYTEEKAIRNEQISENAEDSTILNSQELASEEADELTILKRQDTETGEDSQSPEKVSTPAAENSCSGSTEEDTQHTTEELENTCTMSAAELDAHAQDDVKSGTSPVVTESEPAPQKPPRKSKSALNRMPALPLTLGADQPDDEILCYDNEAYEQSLADAIHVTHSMGSRRNSAMQKSKSVDDPLIGEHRHSYKRDSDRRKAIRRTTSLGSRSSSISKQRSILRRNTNQRSAVRKNVQFAKSVQGDSESKRSNSRKKLHRRKSPHPRRVRSTALAVEAATARKAHNDKMNGFTAQLGTSEKVNGGPALKPSITQQENSKRGIQRVKEQHKNIRLVLAIFVVYFAFCAPYQVLQLVEAVCDSCQLPAYLSLVLEWISYSACLLVPLVQFAMNKDFRGSLCQDKE